MARGRKHDHAISGHVEKVAALTTANGLFSLALDPTITNVTTNLANVYRYYRFTRIKFTLYPNSTSNYTAQYLAGGGTTTYGAADDSKEGKIVMAVGSFQTIPGHMHIPYEDLCNQTPWFVTDLDATDAYLDIVGYISIEMASAGSGTVLYRIEVDYEFKFPQHTEVSFLQTKRLVQKNAQERQKCSRENSETSEPEKSGISLKDLELMLKKVDMSAHKRD